ncbi:hypothetical protein ACFY1J_07315 [Streptomyces sp. NPDC001406]|uniref:hypothetical protein n=1 Tax=Streptomyces sp. NPDC001406 TaxID=3364572 RepID=UPI0036AF979D
MRGRPSRRSTGSGVPTPRARRPVAPGRPPRAGIIFLASAPDFMTGQVLIVDGGYSTQ